MFRFLLGLMIFLASTFLLSVTVILRCLPPLFRALLPFLRIFFTLSLRLYKVVLNASSPYLLSLTGVKILYGVIRLVACLLLSALLMLFILILIDFNFLIPMLILSALHGLVIHLLWDELDSNMMNLGSRMD